MTAERNGKSGDIYILPSLETSLEKKEAVKKGFWHIDRETLRYKFPFFLFMGALGVVIPFIPVVFSNRIGLTASSIVTLLVTSQFLSMVSKPLLGYIADYTNKLKVIIGVLTNILKDVGKVLKSKEFLSYLLGVFMKGMLSGFVVYLMIFLNEIGESRFLLGMMQCVQALLEKFPLVLPVECLHGISYGVYYPAVAAYAKLSAKQRTEATTQAVLFTTHEGIEFTSMVLITDVIGTASVEISSHLLSDDELHAEEFFLQISYAGSSSFA
ncbi:major facilitator superfamily domain-containing protein 6 [Trichonephila inaurata madagascariensis]|uniref:Major facilitator superfamily domain-containing protein 6 n=1 Tax=Trichonephila inaurata madagascariensis TaxID=2747483 RepID=A0A8X6XDV6_9ARAC|nr:major facilitator superfamily domain-containing protein 6 [Trichonephila inaurata madagascariensis]